MAIDNVILPFDISEGSRFGPEFSTSVLETPGGYEQRVSQWQTPRHKGQVGYGVRTVEQLAQLKAFFLARGGRSRGFLFRDNRDCGADSILLGVGDGVIRTFQLRKAYGSGSDLVYRKITRPEAGSIQVSVNGTPVTGFTVVGSTGVLTLADAPGTGLLVRASFAFFVPVRFDTDHMDTSLEGILGGWESIAIVEVRE